MSSNSGAEYQMDILQSFDVKKYCWFETMENERKWVRGLPILIKIQLGYVRHITALPHKRSL